MADRYYLKLAPLCHIIIATTTTTTTLLNVTDIAILIDELVEI